MAIAKRPAPRKRPPPKGRALLTQPGDAGAAVTTSSKADVDAEAQNQVAQEVLRDFEDALSNEPSIDPATRAQLSSYLREAVEEAVKHPVLAKAPTLAAVRKLAQRLEATGPEGQLEAASLTRTMESALAVFEQKETKVALEFSRILSEQGQEQALAWLRTQQMPDASDAQETSSGPTSRNPASPLKSEVAKSRSRRLRGPPGRGK